MMIQKKLQKEEFYILFRQKDFLNNKQEITLKWQKRKMNTYEYLLYINKYGSRSLNDINQYYIFPWILLDFSNIDNINKNEKELFQFIKNNINNKKLDDDFREPISNLRNLRYPMSVQIERQYYIKLEKYKDEDETFKYHHSSHYSTNYYVNYYLMRNEPYNSLMIEFLDFSKEKPNHLLLRFKDTIDIINSGYDNRELP